MCITSSYAMTCWKPWPLFFGAEEHADPRSGHDRRLRRRRGRQIVIADTDLEVLYWLELMIARDFIQPLPWNVVMDVVECAIERAQERRL